jgi:hypothetical protein
MLRLALLTLTAVIVGPVQVHADAREWIAANRAAILAEHAALLAIPNVASDTPNMRRNADALLRMLRERGLEARLLESDAAGAPPAVFAE